MGQFALIDSYLDSFHKSVQWRPDSDDLVAEVADHLLIAVERSVALGVDPIEAQVVSLGLFGEPVLVSRAFASTGNGGVALPTEYTRRAGLVGMISAGLLLFVLVTFAVSQYPVLARESLEPLEMGPWPIWSVAGVLAFAGLAVMIIGLSRRHGKALGPSALIGAVLAGVGAVMMIAPWMLAIALPLAGLGTLAVGVALLRQGTTPRVPTVLFTTGPTLAALGAGVARLLEFGPIDYWGDYAASFVIGELVAAVLFVPGFFYLGRWLHSEVAVEEPESPIVA